ncbi:MAG TPA: flagellar biosynthetic protein FliO [Paucimonas sp.]|nr:flagellar biosynthetic protein FliO [Paucimonas sp.]
MKHLRAIVLGLLFAWHCSSLAESTPAPQSVRLPFKQSTAQDDSVMYRALGAFFLACAAAGGIAYGIKRYLPRLGNKTKKANSLQRVETLRLTPRSVLHVIRYRDEEILIAESAHGIQFLTKGTGATADFDGEKSIE